MRIIYLHQYFNTPEMSGGTRSYEMARRLVDAGHEVHMVTSCREDTKKKGWFTTVEAGIQVHWLPLPYNNKMNYTDRIKAFFRFAILAAKKATSLPQDVVFATSTPLTIALPAVYAARSKKVPMVFEVRDLWPELPIAIGALRNPMLKVIARWLERWAYRNAESVVALSPGMRDGAIAAGYAADRVAVIPNSSDNDFFREVDKGEVKHFREDRPWLLDRPLLVYAGTFGRINGVGYLVDLAVRLRVIAPEVRILLVGDGLEVECVRKSATEASVLGVNFHMEPKISKKEIPVLFSAADMTSSTCIDLPELRANSANKFFDSLAASRPILLNYGGWQAELVEAADCGIVTWGLPINEAADRVAECLGDRAWLDSAGQAANSLAREIFDRGVLAGQLEQILFRAVEGEGQCARTIAEGEYASVIESLYSSSEAQQR